MIYIKLLSGEVIPIEISSKEIQLENLVSLLSNRQELQSPFPVFFLEDREVQKLEMIPDESILSVIFRPYKTYFVWSGGNNMVWPGQRDKTMCIDCTRMEQVEWDPSLISCTDALAVDYLSFGLYGPYCENIKDVLHVDHLPIDMDWLTFQDILVRWREQAVYDTEKLSFTDFISKYSNFGGGSWVKYLWLFRVTDTKDRTAYEWISRVTM